MRPRNHKHRTDIGMAVRGWTLVLVALGGLVAAAQAGAETEARHAAAIAETRARIAEAAAIHAPAAHDRATP